VAAWGALLLTMVVTLHANYLSEAAPNNQPLLSFSLLMALIIMAGLVYSGEVCRGFAAHPRPWPAVHHRWLLGATLLLGAFLRLYDLGGLPNYIDPDSAQNGFTSMILSGELLERGEFRAVLSRWALGNEAAFLYVQGLFQRALGVGPLALRLPSALAGVATIYALYRLGAELFSRRLGLLAAALLAVSPWHIYLSRLPKRPILTPLFMTLALLFLARALRAPSVRKGAPSLVACGLCLGLGLHGYEAFRLVPLVVAAALVWHRLACRAPGRGAAELGVVAATAALVGLPIILFALERPEVYFHHVSSAALASGGEAQSGVAAFISNARTALQYFFFFLPGNQGGHPIHRTLPALASVLCLLGLGALVLTRRRGLTLAPGARPILYSSMGAMLLVLLLAEHQVAPRRAVGLLAPYFLLAAGAALGLAGAVIRRLPRRFAATPALLLGVLMLAPLPDLFLELNNPDRDPRQDAMVRLMRWASHEARRQEVYLAPSVRDKHQLVLFHLHNKNIHRLPTFAPLPNGALEKDALLVSLEERWEPALARLYGASSRPVQAPPDLVRALGVKAYIVPGKTVRALRLPPSQGEYRARLMVPATAEYRFSADGQGARLQLDTGPLEPIPSGGIPHSLSAGLHTIHFIPGPGKSALRWRQEQATRDEPIPAAALWSMRVEPALAPPGVARETIRLGVRGSKSPWLDDTAPGGTGGERTFQDLARRGDTYYILDAGLERMRTWSRSGGAGKPISLRFKDGRPFGLDSLGATDLNMYRIHDQLFRLTASDGGFYLLDLLGRRLHRFTDSGVYLGQLPARLGRPTDVAAAGDKLYIADLARQAVLVLSSDEEVNPRERIRRVRPVALDQAGGRLALLDMASHTLGVFNAADGKRLLRVPLGRVGLMSTLALDDAGHALVTQRRKDRATSQPDQIWLMASTGRILTPDSNPNHLALALRAGGVERFQAVSLDMSRGLIMALGELAGGVGRLTLRGERK